MAVLECAQVGFWCSTLRHQVGGYAVIAVHSWQGLGICHRQDLCAVCSIDGFFNWTQIFAFHSNTYFNDNNVRVRIVYFFAAGHGAYIHVQLRWEFLSTHLWFISVPFGEHLLGLGRLHTHCLLILPTAACPFASGFSWCHQLLLAVICTITDQARALDAAVGMLQFLDTTNDWVSGSR